MCDLSNAEAYNRWKFAQKDTAKAYWYDFLLSRANRGDRVAKQYVNDMDALFNK